MSKAALHSQGIPRLQLPRPRFYAERQDQQESKYDQMGRRVAASVVTRMVPLRSARLRAIVPATKKYAQEMRAASDAELQQIAVDQRRALRVAMTSGEPGVAAIAPAFALVREAAERTLGFRHHDVQLLGAWAMMKGMVAEMNTGEGKTLCATLAASAAALSGWPVHVITVNDYLAKYGAEAMTPLYRFLGLSVGVVQAGQDFETRRQIYARDVVYCTNKELAFDYLRDRMEVRNRLGNLRRKVECLTGEAMRPNLRLRGLHFAIVDEADSVLIDEARTPLIISGQISSDGGVDTALFETAMEAARDLKEGRHFRIPKDEKRIELLDPGTDLLDDLGDEGTGAFRVRVIREHTVKQALSALHLFHRGEEYILRDDEVQIVDEYTGRVMADRSWSEGLHQMVELKEGLEPTPPRETQSRITYQRFFRRYVKLAGMTGTASDAAWELWSVYRLAIARIPTHRPDIRTFGRDRLYASEAAKWTAITERVAELHRQSKPVLLGTRSVAASEEASHLLEQLGIPHQVLSASQDSNEAAIIGRAGEAGRVTVATNMAGRGVDIQLDTGINERGGLHVILSERHDSRRIDRQLEGRCGRQGERGRVEAFLSLEDELMRGQAAALPRRLATVFFAFGLRRAAVRCMRFRQKQVEGTHGRMRRDLLDSDRNLGQLLAVSGELE
ncbi:preprotein translocase subunit SecA [Roseibium album]|nr:preprotein translocase subunit SecA [Roseibium album]